jgi:hypothetical protein
MHTTRISWRHDVIAADWIVQRARGSPGTVGSLVPEDFEAYGRIMHLGRPADPPAEGTLPADLATALAAIAADFTTTPERCWFGLWDGYGWLYAGRGASGPTLTGVGTLASLSSAQGVPRAHLSERDFLLYTAPLSAVTALSGYPTHQTPNLWWPDDRAWYVLTDIDLISTYVGGSRRFIQRLLAETRFAASRVSVGDPLVHP